ncbi:hypothetical protein Acr_00g0000350 [Actinidia rufa]|uniref:Uncharacterized protein n=1 Tax=Actinidia rufa TaxID=165716 RepID=A0A7J0D808_9ERIC|nr:hypothetical protein Acr_00g0000350 [Actinidia rufa]
MCPSSISESIRSPFNVRYTSSPSTLSFQSLLFAWNLIAAQHSKVKGAHSESRDTVWYPLSSIEGYKANAIYTGQGREWRIPHNLYRMNPRTFTCASVLSIITYVISHLLLDWRYFHLDSRSKLVEVSGLLTIFGKEGDLALAAFGGFFDSPFYVGEQSAGKHNRGKGLPYGGKTHALPDRGLVVPPFLDPAFFDEISKPMPHSTLPQPAAPRRIPLADGKSQPSRSWAGVQ